MTAPWDADLEAIHAEWAAADEDRTAHLDAAGEDDT